MLTLKRDPFSSVSSNTPVNRGMLSENQYNWSVGQGNKIDLGNGQYGDLRNALDRPDNPIKDVFNEEGVRIGAYNTQTGYRYGLQNTNRESTGTESIVKNQNDIVNGQSPDLNVNQTVESAKTLNPDIVRNMDNSPFIPSQSPVPTFNAPKLFLDKDKTTSSTDSLGISPDVQSEIDRNNKSNPFLDNIESGIRGFRKMMGVPPDGYSQ
ncbi:MAG TPA: hypothetical protein V6C58_25750 [Allocoleopsis sp.]